MGRRRLSERDDIDDSDEEYGEESEDEDDEIENMIFDDSDSNEEE